MNEKAIRNKDDIENESERSKKKKRYVIHYSMHLMKRREPAIFREHILQLHSVVLPKWHFVAMAKDSSNSIDWAP